MFVGWMASSSRQPDVKEPKTKIIAIWNWRKCRENKAKETAMTLLKNTSVRPYGHHAYRPVIGFVEPHPGLGYDGQRIMGVIPNAHFIYGSFRSLNGEKFYSFVRHYGNHGALGFTAFEADTNAQGEDSDFGFNKRSKEVYQGAAMADQQDGIWGVRDIFDGAPRFEVRASPSEVRWTERNLVSVTAQTVGTVIQICVPDSNWPLVYNSRCARARGTFLDHEVEGWMQMDCAYLPDGKDWFGAPYIKEIQSVWSDFATTYEDGAIDHGMLFCGKDRFNAFCVESSDRASVVVTDPDVELEFGETQHPIRISVDAGNGEIWDWKRLKGNKARIPSTNIEDTPRWTQGHFTRRGETRAVTSADSWMETHKHRFQK